MINNKVYLTALTNRYSLESIYKQVYELGDPIKLGTFFLLEHLQKAIDESNWVANNYQDLINEKQ